MTCRPLTEEEKKEIINNGIFPNLPGQKPKEVGELIVPKSTEPSKQ